MTIQHIRQRPPLQVADRLCPICCSLSGEPCRKVLSPAGTRKLKLGARMPKIHPARDTTATSTPVVAEPAPAPHELAAQRRAAEWEREKKLWEKDKRARGL